MNFWKIPSLSTSKILCVLCVFVVFQNADLHLFYKVSEFFFLCLQVLFVFRIRLCNNRHPFGDFQSVSGKGSKLFWIIGKQSHLRNTKVSQYLCANAVITFIRGESELFICLDGI